MNLLESIYFNARFQFNWSVYSPKMQKRNPQEHKVPLFYSTFVSMHSPGILFSFKRKIFYTSMAFENNVQWSESRSSLKKKGKLIGELQFFSHRTTVSKEWELSFLRSFLKRRWTLLKPVTSLPFKYPKGHVIIQS